MQTFLKQLLGRIKNNMSTLFITIAGFCFPSGIGIFIFYMESNLKGIEEIGTIILIFGLLLIAIVCWALAINVEKIERAKEDAKFIRQIQSLEALRQDTITSMNTIGSNINDLSSNINDLINEIRKDRDERNKPNTQPKT
jgi:hypothetical protein